MPSRRARFFNRLIRQLVRRRTWGDPHAVARRARQIFGAPAWYTTLRAGGTTIETTAVPIRGEWVRPVEGKQPGVILYLHGGGYVSCSPRTHRPITAALARLSGSSVFVVDYRLAPEHRFPAALDDATAGYDWLLSTGIPPSSIAIGGDSAGGGMMLGLLLRLRERNALPSCAFAFSPWTDLTGTSPSNHTNDGRCAMFHPKTIVEFAAAYLDGASPRDPVASPVFADLSALPPLLLHVSDSELLLDDSRRVHESIQRSGAQSTLTVFVELAHGWQLLDGLVPEARESLNEAARFVRSHIK